jgi:hypothetical protein
MGAPSGEAWWVTPIGVQLSRSGVTVMTGRPSADAVRDAILGGGDARRRLSGEQRLALECLFAALHTLESYPRWHALYALDWDWIMGGRAVMTCETVCAGTELSVDYVRRLVRKFFEPPLPTEQRRWASRRATTKKRQGVFR